MPDDLDAFLAELQATAPPPKPIIHTPACLARLEAYSAYIALGPSACHRCGATGVIIYPQTWEEPEDREPCSKCLGNVLPLSAGNAELKIARCPRCGKHEIALYDDNAPLVCLNRDCGWTGKNPGDTMPEVDCWCWEG